MAKEALSWRRSLVGPAMWGRRATLGRATEGGVLRERFSFVDIEADLEVGDAVTGDTDEGSFVDDGTPTDVDEDAAGADGAEEFFGDDVVIFFGGRGRVRRRCRVGRRGVRGRWSG